MTLRSLRTSTSSLMRLTGALPSLSSILLRPFRTLLCTLAITSIACAAATPPPPAPVGAARLDRDFGKVPLSFEPNRGQVDSQVQFLSRGQGYALYLTPGEAVLQLQKPTAKETSLGKDGRPVPQPAPETSTLRMTLVGADAKAAVSGEQPLPGTANYFVGNDSSKWHAALPTYKRVSYKSVYPGVDLVYYGNQRELEYDFIVAPEADAAKIALQFTGANPVVDKAGDLVLSVQGEEARFHKPVVYQLDGDRKLAVEGSYQIADGKVGFALGAYDHSKALVIDPVLSYLTYIGGSSNDLLNGMAIDSAGSVYIVGTTNSTDYPVKNAYKATDPNVIAAPNPLAIFVSKFNATGTALVYSTYLGSSEYTYGNGIAVDSGGNAYVVGYTAYGDYPVTSGAFQTLCGANNTIPQGSPAGVRANGCVGAGQGDSGGLLTKLSPSGTSLVYSTYLSGNNYNEIKAVAVNSAGEAYVTGATNSFCPDPPYNANGTGYQSYYCFPTTTGTAQSPTNRGGTIGDAFLAKFDAAGANLLYSSILGGTFNPGYGSSAVGYAVAVDAAGNGYIGGSATFPLLTTAGSYQPAITSQTGVRGFVAKFNTTSKQLLYSTFLSGTTAGGSDTVYGIAADAAGNAYLAGSTAQCTFPTTAGAYQVQASYPPGTTTNCNAGFVTKLNPSGSALVWSTFIGNEPAPANNSTQLNAITLGNDGSIYVAGQAGGYGYSVLNPVVPQTNTSRVPVITRLNSTGSSLLFSTTLSGTAASSDAATGIAVDPAGNIYVGGQTNSFTMPVTQGAFQTTNKTPGGNAYTGFVAKIAPLSTSTTTLVVSPASASFGQTVTLTATVAGPQGGSVPTGTVSFKNGSTTLGTGTLNSSGVATFTSTTLAPNTCSITAVYAGDSGYSGSTSTAQPLTVAAVSTTTVLTITPAATFTGQTVTISAKITPVSGSAIPTGTVTFKNGSTVLSAVAVDSTGKAVLTTSSLGVATYSITAAYSGDATFATSTSSAGALVITASLSTTTTLSASATSAVVGTGITFTAQVSPASGSIVATGTVTFKDGSTALGTGTLDGTGKVTYVTSALTVSTHSITAVYGGDTGNNSSTSAALTITITAAAPDFTLSLTATSGNASLKQINAQATPLVRLATTTATVTPLNDFNAATTFSCSGLPSNSTCAFSPATLTPSGSPITSTVTITTDVVKANLIQGVVSSNTTNSNPARKSPFLPVGGSAIVLGLLCCTGFGGHKALRNLTRCLVAFFTLATLTLSITGCGDTPVVKTPAGTYNVVVTATAGATIHNATYTLTVAQ